MSTKLTIKFTYIPTQDCRRLLFDPLPAYTELLSLLSKWFHVDAPSIDITYIDSENDYVRVACEEDLRAAAYFAEELGHPPVLKLLINVKPKSDRIPEKISSDATADDLRRNVSQRYAELATAKPKSCGCKAKKYAMSLGYTSEDLEEEITPVGALSCGNPVGIANLKAGESVMDLGCGTGFDCRLAAKRVGPSGKVVGVDMTKEMLDKAAELTKPDKYPQISYRRSTIEDVGSIEEYARQFDAVLSNCVFNLSPEKQKVLNGVYTVLKPGGRLIFSDPVALRPIPASVKNDMASYTQCMANASSVDSLSQMLSAAGFERVAVEVKDDSTSYIRRWTPNSQWEGGLTPSTYIATATVWAYKPSL